MVGSGVRLRVRHCVCLQRLLMGRQASVSGYHHHLQYTPASWYQHAVGGAARYCYHAARDCGWHAGHGGTGNHGVWTTARGGRGQGARQRGGGGGGGGERISAALLRGSRGAGAGAGARGEVAMGASYAMHVLCAVCYAV